MAKKTATRHKKGRRPSRRSTLDTWFQSATNGEVETLCQLLEEKRVIRVDIQDRNRRTALYFAAKKGKEHCVSALLELGADPNSHSIHGTPAHAAVEKGHLTSLSLLFRYGASLEALNHKRRTVLQCATKKFGRTTINILLKENERLKKQGRSMSLQVSNVDEEDDASRCGLRAPVPHVLGLELESYEQHAQAQGTFSFYIKGKLRGSHVTIKKYRWEVKKELQRQMFENEATVLSELRHPNVLLLMAICNSPALSEQGLVMESVERAFVAQLIYEKNVAFDEDAILRFGRDVACAMQYVHGRGYLHCNLGSHSVVLDENYTAKICNFEYAQHLFGDDTSGYPLSHLVDLYDWMAPEQLSGKPADRQGDVFSFGIFVGEFVSKKKPLKDLKTLSKVTEKRDPRWPRVATNWSANVKYLIEDCLKQAEKRPTFEQIYEWLSCVVTSQYICVRPTSLVLQEQKNFFPIK